MGLIKDANKAAADSIYERSREFLRKKNGLTHVMCYVLEGKLGDGAAQCETRLTTYLNQILLGLQNDGYEVTDVKMDFIPEKSAISGIRQLYLVTITYK